MESNHRILQELQLQRNWIQEGTFHVGPSDFLDPDAYREWKKVGVDPGSRCVPGVEAGGCGSWIQMHIRSGGRWVWILDPDAYQEWRQVWILDPDAYQEWRQVWILDPDAYQEWRQMGVDHVLLLWLIGVSTLLLPCYCRDAWVPTLLLPVRLP